MDRNNMRSTYVNSGPRSVPHNGSKRQNGNGHNGARLSPPAASTVTVQNNNNNTAIVNSQHEELINYIYDSWSKIQREIERGNENIKFYQELPSQQLSNFRPFDLEEWWGRRLIQSINRNKPRS